ncbi:hypothetical protein F2P81_016724 [Scophthalmus maximus]|uniref:Uncharacterized protein n=1 Tax=Scophthalmus maximus TaxID=52904 RepID=A0A6A4S6E7_SCOMX|nr:hypothetical protein F2P81_016724 [Scophthalmus maximus]
MVSLLPHVETEQRSGFVIPCIRTSPSPLSCRVETVQHVAGGAVFYFERGARKRRVGPVCPDCRGAVMIRLLGAGTHNRLKPSDTGRTATPHAWAQQTSEWIRI